MWRWNVVKENLFFPRRRSCGRPCWLGILTWSSLITRPAPQTSRCRERRILWRPGAGSHPCSLVSKHVTMTSDNIWFVHRAVLILDPGWGQRSDCADDEQASLSSSGKAGKVRSLQRLNVGHLYFIYTLIFMTIYLNQGASKLDMMLILWSGLLINFTQFLLTGKWWILFQRLTFSEKLGLCYLFNHDDVCSLRITLLC